MGGRAKGVGDLGRARVLGHRLRCCGLCGWVVWWCGGGGDGGSGRGRHTRETHERQGTHTRHERHTGDTTTQRPKTNMPWSPRRRRAWRARRGARGARPSGSVVWWGGVCGGCEMMGVGVWCGCGCARYLAGGEGGLLGVARELAGLRGEALEDVVDEGVEDGDAALGDARVGVHLLQHLLGWLCGGIGFVLGCRCGG